MDIKAIKQDIADIIWEDPECDPNAAIIQIQEYLQYILNKDLQNDTFEASAASERERR